MRPFGCPVRLLADEDPVDRRRRLQASRRIDHVARDQSLAGVCARVDADEGLPGVHCKSNVDGVLLQRPVANRQCRTHRALGVVFVDERRSEDGDDRIADELFNGASMTLELRPDAGVIRRQLRADVLGIQLLCACRRPNKVAEHDGDDLTFLNRPGSRGEARAALRAELRLWRILRAAS